jgi:hypothetical protein
MIRTHVAALLAYAVKLDPRSAPTDDAAAAECLDQWADILADVPATAPHPDGHDWNAAHAVRNHIATSPYPIKPSDVSRPWHTFKADILGRHTNSFDPHTHPEIDPDDPHAYRAALYAERQAVATGQALPVPYKELTEGPREVRERRAAERLAELGTYMPRTVADTIAAYRPQRAERERLARLGRPDPLNVPCPYEPCHAPTGEKCRNATRGRPTRATAHPSRLDAATARHAQTEVAA